MEGRTRDLLASRLGVPIRVREDSPYRISRPAPLDGEWLGGFVQPAGIVLSGASAMRVTFAGATGSSRDEYGTATLSVTERSDKRVAWRKAYSNAGSGRTLCYVGRLSSGTLAGYWYAPERPWFAGVFWLARVETLVEPRLIESRVRSWSWRRIGFMVLVWALMWFALALRGVPPVAKLLLIVSPLVGLYAYQRVRARALAPEVQDWRAELG